MKTLSYTNVYFIGLTIFKLTPSLETKLKINKYSPKVLHHYIEAFKVYHFKAAEEVHLYPKGVFEIVFQSQQSFQHFTDYSLGWKYRPRNFIGGLHNKSYLVNPGESKMSCIVVEFKANTAKYFVPEKLHNFQNAVIDIFDVWGKDVFKLSQKIDRESTDKLKIEHIENFLLTKLLKPTPSTIDKALEMLFHTQGFVEVNDLSNCASLSAPQFRKRFKEEIGISPSQYCKIVRVKSSLSIIKELKHKSLTDITYDLGYFDQSHFIRDFKSVMGQSPKAFLNNPIF